MIKQGNAPMNMATVQPRSILHISQEDQERICCQQFLVVLIEKGSPRTGLDKVGGV